MDFYALLGLTRAASALEIERAYRRLSRRYHPGVNPGDRVSEEIFRQIQEAYAVLADSVQRRQYDLGTAPVPPRDEPIATVAFEGFDFTVAAEGALAGTFSELFSDVFQDAAREATAPTRGADIELPLTVAFVDAARGGEIPLSVIRHERCANCHGRGHVARPSSVCPVCAGEGTRKWARGHLVFTKACDTCGGEGRLTTEGCRTCSGVGTAARSEVVTVSVAAGTADASRIAVPGRGHAGARGGPAGDLYVTVEVLPHPVFQRDGRDLVLTLPIAVHEAALGARIDVPTLDGPVRLRVPAGTQSGQRFRIPGRGIGPATEGGAGHHGDLLVDIEIVLPASLDEASKELLREFGRLNGADVRRHLFETERH